MPDADREAMMETLRAHREHLDQRQKELDAREARLIDSATQQAMLLVLLRFARKRMKASDLNEIEHAARLVATDDYRPAGVLSRLLQRTRLELEEKRERPG
jgi:uncharacterized protein YciI